jgi:DNA-directed RNA polymerase specialized sigma24 family protein
VAHRREFPTDPTNWFRRINEKGRSLGGSRPLTDIEALMRLSPHQESVTPSLMETMALKEAVGAAIDALEPEDKWIFNALFVEELSLRTAGWILGIPKTSLARRRDYIMEQLRESLSKSPDVMQWLRDGLGFSSFHALA